MNLDQTILSDCFAFLHERATNLLFILSEEGKIIHANQYANNVTGIDLIGRHIRDVFVDFTDNFEINSVLHDPSQEHLISVSNSSDLPQSFYFTFKAIRGYILVFGRLDAEELVSTQKELLVLNNELNNLTRKLNKKNAELQAALDHVKTLQGILPICMHCHQIRNDQQTWEKLEAYLSEHSEVKFSHSICPECAKKYYPDLDIYDD